jgi:hypothetical protein
LPSRAAPIQTCHLGGCASLVDEHQPCGVKIRLSLEPSFARGSDVGPVALAGVGGFLPVIARTLKKRQSVPIPAETPRSSLSFARIS